MPKETSSALHRLAAARPSARRSGRPRICAPLALLVASSSASAQSVAEFYRAHPIAMIVASGAGGGYDVYGRVLASYYGRHIPGNPPIVVQNMDLASGLEATNYVANKAARDGSVILATFNSLLTQPMFDNNNVRYDVLKMTWIGNIAKSIAICETWRASPVKTLEQARSREALMGATGATGNNAVFPRVLNQLAGTRMKTILGYSSSGVFLAVERGEIDGVCGTGYAAIMASKPDWLLERKINILSQFGLKRAAEMPDVPMAVDFVSNPDDRKIFELMAYPQEMGRPIGGPPGMPPDRLQALRRGFDATMKDADFLAAAKKAHLDVDPMTGEAMVELLEKAYATPKDVVARYVSLTSSSSGK
jgi:tripartite-type tricarboxylate transporter receptor subunit TctC